MALLWPFDLCFLDMHFSFACLFFVFRVFSFVGDTHIASVIVPFSKDCRLLSDLGVLKLDSWLRIEELVNTAQVS